MVKALVQAQQLFQSTPSPSEHQEAVNRTISAALGAAIAGKACLYCQTHVISSDDLPCHLIPGSGLA
jgi:hypothetical protein